MATLNMTKVVVKRYLRGITYCFTGIFFKKHDFC